jgi:phytoene/squalene synthetase
MLAVMAFDAERRGRLVSQRELAEYSRWLSSAVTEAMHYFIGHQHASPHTEARYLAVTAAHITHMLRDTFEDVAAGYYNIPREYLDSHTLTPQAVDSAPYRAWVQHRVQLARSYFRAGRSYLAQVENFRCRLAGYAYMARFTGVLDAIEQEGYHLRAAYTERKSLSATLRMLGSAFGQALGHHSARPATHTVAIRSGPQ